MPSRKGRDKRRQHAYRKPAGAPARKFNGHHHCPDDNKWCYATRDDATDAVRLRHPGSTVHYYKCGDWWHFTSMSAGQMEGIREREGTRYPEDDPFEPEETVA